MLLRDLSDAFAWIRRILFRLDRLEGGAMLENSSISHGRMRFIGGLLLIDSGGTLTVIGHLNGVGDFVWDGPWALKGDGEITGDVSITGDLALLDDGKFTSGQVLIEGGKIYAGAGGSQIVIDGASGEIQAGSMTISPTSNGGSVKFAGGPEVYASGDTLYLYSTSAGSFVEVGDVVKINGPGARYLEVDGSGFQFVGMPTTPLSEAPDGAFIGAVISDAAGNLSRVVLG